MITFARYYKKNKLIIISNEEIIKLLDNPDKKKRAEISDHIYYRLYNRFLKIFDYQNSNVKKYFKNGKEVQLNEFNEEFKNGFLIMASCSLLIETLAGFLNGLDKTANGKGDEAFNQVFEFAKSKKNKLSVFNQTKFYNKIRCGLLHQGQTKERFLITREGKNLFKDETIDAYLFHSELKKLLNEYRKKLNANDFNSDIWKKCTDKINCIALEK
ncbi:MAG: hypothetical protein CMC07_02255 [Flavobacteriaceae bacterium]|nr:hypothetical protein [Flavobacteriaceae bacterium]|tara:strand:+ start:512 stop:1153 length:642 start_codon:yes stop_codon:yes gene_type:complete